MPTLTESASWLLNAGIDDMQYHLTAMTGTPQDLADLRAAIATELAKPKHQQRPSRLKPIQAKLRKFESVGPHKVPSIEVEVLTRAEARQVDLSGHAQRINDKVAIITGHENAFEESTLEHRLLIGLELAHAKAAFGMSNEDRARLGGDAKAALSPGDIAAAPPLGGSMSPGDMLKPNPLGFTSWLAREVPDFKRAKADLYVNAFHALGLTRQKATPKLIREKLKNLIHQADKSGVPRPTLKSLYKLGKPAPVALTIIETEDPLELRIGDAREFVATWIATWDNNVKAGRIEDLPAAELPKLFDFITEVREHVRLRIKSSKPALK